MHFNQVEFLANPDEVAHARVSSMWKLVDSLKLEVASCGSFV